MNISPFIILSKSSQYSHAPLFFYDSTREAALKKLVDLTSQHFTADVLDSQRDDLMDLLKKSIKKGGPRECVLAAEGMYHAAV